MEASFRFSHTFGFVDTPQAGPHLEYIRALQPPLGELFYEPGWRSEGWLAAIEGLLADTGLKVASLHSAFGTPYDLSLLDTEAREHSIEVVLDSLAMQERFDGDLIVVHASSEPVEPAEREARLEAARESITRIGEAFAAKGLRLALELLPRTCLGNCPDELFYLLQDLSQSDCGICLDTNHPPQPADLLPMMDELGESIIHLHISDFDGVERHWLPYEGTIDWHGFMEKLVGLGYSGAFNYEVFPTHETTWEKVDALIGSYVRLLDEVSLEPNPADEAWLTD